MPGSGLIGISSGTTFICNFKNAKVKFHNRLAAKTFQKLFKMEQTRYIMTPSDLILVL